MDSTSPYEYNDLVRQILFCLIDKAAYLKYLDPQINDLEESYFQGQVIAYHQIIEAVFELIQLNGLKLEDFGVEHFNPLDVLNYKPRAVPKNILT